MATFNNPYSSAHHGPILTEDEQPQHHGLCLPLTHNGRFHYTSPHKKGLLISIRHNRKLTRKTLCSAKIKQVLEVQTNSVIIYYNFSKPHRGLTLKDSRGKRIKRTPAMAANLIERIWPMSEIPAYPIG
jgi:hypothetical protein